MNDISTLEFSKISLDSALRQMAELGIPTIPNNIAVWYEYCEGNDQELVTEVSRLLNEQTEFTEELNKELYSRFFDAMPRAELEEYKAALRDMTLKLSADLMELTKDEGPYNDLLDDVEKQLEEGCELEQLRKITTLLVSESRKMSDNNARVTATVKNLAQQMDSLQDNLAQAKKDALTDKLTGVANRRAFDAELERQLAERGQYPNGVTILAMDIDHFKQFNDTYGHSMGDKVLRFVARMVMKNIKGQDFLARTGGEEFMVILENTNLQGGRVVAESIRKALASARLTVGADRQNVGKITTSVGVAWVKSSESQDELIDRVDKYLYLAKAKGRNLVVCEKAAECETE